MITVLGLGAHGLSALQAPASTARQGYADLPGVRLWYTDTGGSGIPVVLLHANTGNSDSWQPNVPAFEKAGYRVIAFDRRGWGRSMATPSTGSQPGTIAGDLHALVSFLHLEKFHLVGIAGGGFAALDYVLTHPERLLSFVLAASTGQVTDPLLTEMAGRTRPPEYNALPVQFREISFSYLATNPEGVKKWLDINSRSQQPGAPAQPPLKQKTLPVLETIKVPALLLSGDNDLTAPPYIMRILAAHIPGSELHGIPEAGHSANWEQPEIFNRLVLEFFSKHPASTSSPEPPRVAVPAREGLAPIPGAELWYVDTGGSGVPVVFLHPASGSVRIWEYQIPAFTAAGYRFIAFDRRDFGRTVIEPSTGPQPGNAADDLNALLDFLRVDRVHLIGCAAGGGVAIDYAVSFPQRVRSLSIVNHAFGGIRDPEFLALMARLRPQPQFNELPPEFREVGLSYQVSNPEGTKRWIELEHISRPKGPRAPPQTRKNDLFLVTLGDQIRVPTLLTAADADPALPPPVMRMIAARVPGAETVVFDDSGHSTYWEQPEVFNRTILDFISRH
jgi:pimeloyl-ACP methyl ester carboxylesterase